MGTAAVYASREPSPKSPPPKPSRAPKPLLETDASTCKAEKEAIESEVGEVLGQIASFPKDKLPNHVAVIMDGNRRFSTERHELPMRGHDQGMKKVGPFLEWCEEVGIREVTLYAFSCDNFKRDKEETDHLMDVFRQGFDVFQDVKNKEAPKKMEVHFIGRKDVFPSDIQEKMRAIEKSTQGNGDPKKYRLNVAMGYSGQQEIVDGVKKFGRDVKEGKVDADSLTTETFSRYLELGSPPDLVIRTGGEMRMSDFLLYHIGYAELFFVQKFWPAFEKADFLNIIKQFATDRNRRYGV